MRYLTYFLSAYKLFRGNEMKTKRCIKGLLSFLILTSSVINVKAESNVNSVSVHACDIHGNVSEASYTVNISAAPTEQTTDTLLYSYRPGDLAGIDGPANWNRIDQSDWYYVECSYLSGQYATVQEALQDVIDHESANGNTANVENEARIFCVTDAEGNVLYYQAGFEE